MLNGLTVLSLMLLAGTIAIEIFHIDFHYLIRNGGGGIRGGGASLSYMLVIDRFFIGLCWTRSDYWGDGRFAVFTPFISLIAGILPAWHVIVFARRIRARQCVGCCHHCRYNLTANVSGVCPECGMKIAESSRAPP
jgi:hypothetical protein